MEDKSIHPWKARRKERTKSVVKVVREKKEMKAAKPIRIGMEMMIEKRVKAMIVKVTRTKKGKAAKTTRVIEKKVKAMIVKVAREKKGKAAKMMRIRRVRR